ncbi:L-threonylcarbamoyladenylate synthase [Lacticaseibacillus saniviri]|uniref:Threonylcarbamoyl-AMP synthase n=1 Tax=Lacticaseibacillus saniviri JCM 17471 = DSM 24301 TaxID=1293598 RepID=A0A0R2MXN3_9LACO|nr:L-threonylcarbamoyladenylate synthase [Lacticaseibacillus saniviri]KRO17628.1 translation factor SUA5 [Lacticaseibacillus saniviri JCM 17471 = DSM 24301]
MATKRLTPDELDEAAQLLKDGQLVAFPTETVYGLGADATNVAAVKQVYQAKGRPSDNPLIVHVADPEMVMTYADVSADAHRLMTEFWPGPLTIILPIKPHALAKEVTGGLNTAAFRLPANDTTRELIRRAGVPMVGPSANTSGKPSPTTATHVLHDLDGKIAAVVDDGPTKVGVESTVIDMTVTPPAVLRPGAIDAAMLYPVIGEVATEVHKVGAKETPKAPGMKYKHYAPNAQVVIVRTEADFDAAIAWAEQQDDVFGVLATDHVLATLPATMPQFSLGQDVTSAAHNLFAGLRYFDNHPDVKMVLAEGFETTGLGSAYMNRINKSAGGQYFTATE